MKTGEIRTDALTVRQAGQLTPAQASRARLFVHNAHAASTWRAYRAHWETFSRFCEQRGVPALPAAPETVCAFLIEQAEGHRPATLSAKCAAIAFQHRVAKLPNPCDALEVRELMRGIRRTLGAAPRRKRAATLDIVRRMVEACGDDLRGRLYRAIVLVGFFGAFRRSELAALRVEDVTFTDYGARILIQRSKTDQEGLGSYKQLERLEQADICPVAALRDWLSAAGITSGYVFRAIDMLSGRVNAQPISARHIARIVKWLAERIGEPPHEFAGHSLRSGFVTSAIAGGAGELDVMEQTGHTTAKMLAVYSRQEGRGARRALRATLRWEMRAGR